MMDSKGDVVTRWQDELRPAVASMTPAGLRTEQHRKMAERRNATAS